MELSPCITEKTAELNKPRNTQQTDTTGSAWCAHDEHRHVAAADRRKRTRMIRAPQQSHRDAYIVCTCAAGAVFAQVPHRSKINVAPARLTVYMLSRASSALPSTP